MVDGAGDVVAGGFIQNSGTGNDLTDVKGSTERSFGGRVINGTANGDDRVLKVGIDTAGNIVAAGKSGNIDTFDDFTVFKLRGKDGSHLGSSSFVN
jgi:hypothetical protein